MLSIHAPTRGATVKNLHFFIDIITFNPRSYKRSDSHLHPLFLHPHTFNPRSYKRSDDNGITFWKSASLSIHAPTRGATKFWSYIDVVKCLSIHAPTRGATLKNPTVLSSFNFQSTLLQEERQKMQFYFT